MSAAMEQDTYPFPDVQRAAQRLARPRARAALAAKRLMDVLLATVMLVALLPLFALVIVLLAFTGDGWFERRVRLGRHGRPVVLSRFRALPGAIGLWLERAGVRDLPLLFAVLRGRLSLVGPRPVPPGTDAGYTGPRRLMAPGLIGPAQRRRADDDAARSLDDAYVERWTLWMDARLLAGRCPSFDRRVSRTGS